MKNFKIILALIFIARLQVTQAQGLLNGLQACYPMDCDNITNMASTGGALNGTPHNISCTTDRNSVSNKAYAFGNSAGSYVALPNDSRIKPNAISFSGWVKFNNVSNRQYVVFTKNTCSSYFEGYDLHGEPSGGNYVLQLVKSGSACSALTEQSLLGVTNLNANTWYHLGFYMGNDSLKLYLDGALESSAPSAVNFDYSADSVYLGGTASTIFNRPLDGDMDNVRFYDRKLDGSEFNTLYAADPGCSQTGLLGLLNGLEGCYPLDCDNVVNMAPTGSALDGTPHNISCTTDRNSVSNMAYAFANSAGSYIELPNDPRLKSTTVSFSGWVKFNNVSNRQYIVFTRNTCSSYFEGYDLHGEPSGGNFVLELVKAGSGCSAMDEQVLTGVTNLSANTWYHVGFYMGNDFLKIYLDGALEASVASAVLFDYSGDNVYLGGTNSSIFNRPLDGDMDNVRFYSRELTAQEMSILYNHDPGCGQTWCANPACTQYLPRPAAAVGLNTNSAQANKAVGLYPNPGAGKISIRNGRDKLITIYDVSGKAVEYTRVAVDEATSEINMVNQAEGIYFVKITDAKGNYLQTCKLVITH